MRHRSSATSLPRLRKVWSPVGLLEIEWRGARVIVAPWVGLRFSAIALLLMALLAGTSEWLLGRECREDRVNCPQADEINKAVNYASAERHRSTFTSPVWSSKGLPLPPRDPSRRRIVVVGDSYVYGDGHANI